MSKLSESEREIVTTLLDSAAVNFEAIGTALAKHGPSAVVALDGEEVFCGSMRRYVRVYRLAGEQAPLEDLAKLREIGTELGG
jgi:hypothetical protein